MSDQIEDPNTRSDVIYHFFKILLQVKQVASVQLLKYPQISKIARVDINEICEGSGNRTPDLQTRTVRPSRQLFLEQIKVLLADDNARKKLTSEEVLASYRFWDGFVTGAGFELETSRSRAD